MIANAIDKAIAVFAPGVALKRLVNRTKFAALSAYRAASKDRLNRDWQAKNLSPDAAIIPDKATVDARARDMVCNNDYAKSYVRYMDRSAVGTGMQPAPQVRLLDGKLDRAKNKLLRGLFWDWATDRMLVDMEHRRTFTGIQRWAVSEFATVGECFLKIAYQRKMNGVGLSFQLIESEQLDRYRTAGENNNEVRGGIEVNEFGAPVAYWVYPRHPNDIVGTSRPTPMLNEAVRHPADTIIHVYDPDRARQTRGMSPMACSMERLRGLSEYDRAQLVAARAEANIGLVIKSDNAGMRESLGIDPETGERTNQQSSMDQFASLPFMVAELQPGEEIQPFVPTRPGGSYQPFVQAQLRASSAGMGASYEQVARDFTTTNFSGLRQALSEDRRETEMVRQVLDECLLTPVWKLFVRFAALEGRFGPGVNLAQLSYAVWRGPAYPWVDPVKDLKATKEAIDIGIMSNEEAALERGRDWYEVQDQLAEEAAYRASLGNPVPEPTQ